MALACSTYVLTLRDGPVPILLLSPGVHVYGWDGERITVGIVDALGEPSPGKRLLRILLEEGHSVRVTHDQSVRTFEGELVQACDLKEGTRLLPLHLKENAHGYLEFQQLRSDRAHAPEITDRRKFRSVARMVAEWKLKARFLDSRTICRHIDLNRKNCDPSNIDVEETPPGERKYRLELGGWARDIRETMEFIKENDKLAQPYNYKTPGDLKNHRVAGVQEIEGDQVVDITLEDGLSFVVGNELGGFFVG